MFIERYKLEHNPFAESSVRPLFVSQSMRQAARYVKQVVEGDLDRLVITGATGVGKTTFIVQQMSRIVDAAFSHVDPTVDSTISLLQKLQHDIGPGVVEGSESELRNILDVYLRHQRINERLSLVIGDGLERQSVDVMREIESLCKIRVKGLPIIQNVLLTRNRDLAADWLAQYQKGRLARGEQISLGGFTVEETASYIRACLQDAGCDWADELLPEHVIFDIQAFTQGIIGDIILLCNELLEALAQQKSNPDDPLAFSEPALRAAAARLHLRHDARERKHSGGGHFSTGTVRVNEPGELKIGAARLIVSRHGKKLAEVLLNRPRMVLGRDSGCDISLDSTYLSRYQNLFMETGEGWMLIDLNSTNGCYVNGRRVNSHCLRDGDLIGVGHHQLRFAAPRGRRKHDHSLIGPDTVVTEQPN